MSLLQRIKEATAIIGITALLNTNSGCATATGTIAGTITGSIDGAQRAYKTHPVLIPFGIAGGLIVGSLTGASYGILGDFLFSIGGIPDEYSREYEKALSHPVCNFLKKIDNSDQGHSTNP